MMSKFDDRRALPTSAFRALSIQTCRNSDMNEPQDPAHNAAAHCGFIDFRPNETVTNASPGEVCLSLGRSINFSETYFLKITLTLTLTSTRCIPTPSGEWGVKCGVDRPQNGAVGIDFDEKTFCTREVQLGLANPL